MFGRRNWSSAPGRSLAGVLVGLILVFTLPGCGGSDDGGTTPPEPSGTPVDAAGGRVLSDGGAASLTIPAGALTQETHFLVEAIDPPPSTPLAGTAFDFQPDGTVFGQPATIGITYDPGALGGGQFASDLRLARQQGNTWLPLADSSVDSVAHLVTGSTDHLSSYGIILPGPTTPADSLVVVLKDNPSGPLEFGTLGEAMTTLSDSLAAGDLGVIRWQTDTPQNIQQLAFDFDLRLVPEEGSTPALEGPAGQPLLIAAAGALNLSGFSITAPAGLVIDANRRLDLNGCQLPANTAVVIGGVKNAPCPAADPAFVPKSTAADSRATGVNVANNDLGDDFQLNLGDSSTLSGNYSLSANHGNSVGVAGTARLSADSKLDFLDNVLPFLDVNVRAQANASFRMSGNTNLDNLNFTADLTGTHDLTFQGNVSAAADLKLSGVGSATLTLSNEIIRNNEWHLGLSNLQLSGSQLNLANLAIIGAAVAVDPDLVADIITSTITENLQINLMDNDAGQLTLNLSQVTLHDVAMTAKYKVEHHFEDVSISGHAQFTLHGDLVDWTQSHSSYDLGVQINAGDVSGGVTIRSQNDTYGGDVSFITPPSVNATLTITGGFLEGGGLYMGNDGKQNSSAAKAVPTRGGVTLNELNWQGSGYSRLEMEGNVGPVTVQDCTLTNTGGTGIGLMLVEVNGAVSIQGNQFTGCGINLNDCPGSCTISNNNLQIAGSSAPGLGLGGDGATTITNNDISYIGPVAVSISDMNGAVTMSENSVDASAAQACCVLGDGNYNIDNNSLLSGMIQILTGRVHMSGNTFSNAMVLDPLLPPGLLNDPVQENDGLSPDDCLTHMDWDGNGCCDYPTEANQKDEHGNCNCDGVGG